MTTFLTDREYIYENKECACNEAEGVREDNLESYDIAHQTNRGRDTLRASLLTRLAAVHLRMIIARTTL